MTIAATRTLLIASWATCVSAQVGPRPNQKPLWTPTYLMNRSTIIMPCNESGYIDFGTLEQGWGLISTDWSNSKEIWAKNKSMNCEELMLVQANKIKTASPTTRAWVYRNAIKALPWFTSVRAKLGDPAYAKWFLNFNCTNSSAGSRCSGLPHTEQESLGCSAGDSCTYVASQDYDRGSSGPLPDVAATSAADCCAKCAAYEGCWAATFPAGQQRCYFKTQNQSTNPSYDSSATGVWPPGHTPPPSPNGACHVPVCDNNYHPPLCSNYYHDQEQTPGYPSGDGTCAAPACDTGKVPVGEYLFDPRAANISVNNQTFLEWYIDEYLFSPTGAGSTLIDGFFFDDQWETSGPTEMESHVVQDLGLSKADLVEMTNAFNWNQYVINAQIVARNKFSWQLLFDDGTTCARPLVKQNTCAADIRSYCNATSKAQTQAIMYGFAPGGCGGDPSALPSFEQDLANFLLIRGDYAWLGNAWQGCNRKYEYPTALNTDYGTPTGLCSETNTGSGVFTRSWTKSRIQMDCNTWTPTITLI